MKERLKPGTQFPRSLDELQLPTPEEMQKGLEEAVRSVEKWRRDRRDRMGSQQGMKGTVIDI